MPDILRRKIEQIQPFRSPDSHISKQQVRQNDSRGKAMRVKPLSPDGISKQDQGRGAVKLKPLSAASLSVPKTPPHQIHVTHTPTHPHTHTHARARARARAPLRTHARLGDHRERERGREREREREGETERERGGEREREGGGEGERESARAAYSAQLRVRLWKQRVTTCCAFARCHLTTRCRISTRIGTEKTSPGRVYVPTRSIPVL
jgi:hypothetical protein